MWRTLFRDANHIAVYVEYGTRLKGEAFNAENAERAEENFLGLRSNICAIFFCDVFPVFSRRTL